MDEIILSEFGIAGDRGKVTVVTRNEDDCLTIVQLLFEALEQSDIRLDPSETMIGLRVPSEPNVHQDGAKTVSLALPPSGEVKVDSAIHIVCPHAHRPVQQQLQDMFVTALSTAAITLTISEAGTETRGPVAAAGSDDAKTTPDSKRQPADAEGVEDAAEDWDRDDDGDVTSLQRSCVKVDDAGARVLVCREHGEVTCRQCQVDHAATNHMAADAALRHEAATATSGKSSRDACAAPDCEQPSTKVCSRCKHMRYCSRDCQAADWRRHKATCNKYSKHLLS